MLVKLENRFSGCGEMGKKTRQEVWIILAKYKIELLDVDVLNEVKSEVMLLGGQYRMKISKG